MDMSDKYKDVITEELRGDIKAILEYVKDIPEMKDDIKQMKLQLDRHEVDIDLLKLGIEHHSKEIKELQKYLPA